MTTNSGFFTVIGASLDNIASGNFEYVLSNRQPIFEISDPDARKHVYGMPYEEWKTKYQK